MTVKKASGKKDEIPVFLQKTWNLINTCDPEIATWSDDGLTFVVKDPDIFASDIIPQFFKHNNFSSFVRQLNFYGFKKVKNDSPLYVQDDESLKWWRFKHESFIRGRPDLLKEIRKANQINAADQQEVDKLKEEVAYLRSEMGRMSSMVEQMAGMLGLQQHPLEEPSNKKRRLEADQVGSVPVVEGSMMPSLEQSLTGCDDAMHPEVSLLDPMVSDEDLLVEEFPIDDYTPGSVTPPAEKMPRCTSADIVESMFDFIKEEVDSNDVPAGSNANVCFQPDSINSFCPYNRSVSYGDDTSHQGKLDPKLSEKLNNAVSMLPKTLQESFVERIVENIASPEAYRKHVDAVGVLATAAAIEAQNQTMISNTQADTSQGDALTDGSEQLSMNNQSEMTLPVAAAALGAFLAKYSNAGEAPTNQPA